MRQADFPGLSRMAQDILCTPAAGVGTERVFNGARDICYFRRARMLPVTIRALTMVHHFEAFHPTFDQEGMIEDSAGLAEMTAAQLKAEEEQRIIELKQAWSRDYISDVEDEESDRPATKALRRDCPYGMAQSRATDQIIAPEVEYEVINHDILRQDQDLYGPPQTPKQKHTPTQTQRRQSRVSTLQVQQQQGTDLESQMLLPRTINSRSGWQIKLS
jgi:hypothetical protein